MIVVLDHATFVSLRDASDVHMVEAVFANRIIATLAQAYGNHVLGSRGASMRNYFRSAKYLLWVYPAQLAIAQIVITTGATTSGAIVSATAPPSDDANWRVTQVPFGVAGIGPARILAQKHPAWFEPGALARWIGPSGSPGATANLDSGTYTYRRQFTLAPNKVYAIIAELGTDNRLIQVRLNGSAVPVSGPTDFQLFFPGSLIVLDQTLFRPGQVNTLEVSLRNAPGGPPGGPNPTGFVLRGTVFQADPTRASQVPASLYCTVSVSEKFARERAQLDSLNRSLDHRSAWDEVVAPTARVWGSTPLAEAGRRSLYGHPHVARTAAESIPSRETVTNAVAYERLKTQRNIDGLRIAQLELTIFDAYFSCLEDALGRSPRRPKSAATMLTQLRQHRAKIAKSRASLDSALSKLGGR